MSGADGIERCAECVGGECREEGVSRGEEQLGRLLASQFIEAERGGGFAGELGGAEFAGGEIEQGEAGARLLASALRGRVVDGGEVVVALGALRGIERGAGREDAGDFAADDLLGELGVLHLLADGDAVALMQQAGDVGFDGVVGNAAHGHLAFAVARGEGDLQLAGGGFGVVVKELVEVAHAEEEQGVRMLRLGGEILPHERGLDRLGGFGWGAGRHGNASIERSPGLAVRAKAPAGAIAGFAPLSLTAGVVVS